MGRTLVLDAGALIDIERGGGQMMVVLAEQAEERGGTVLIPASALGQAWRGGPRAARLAKLIEASEIDVLNEIRAKEAGMRLGTRGGSDVADAHVVCCAVNCRGVIATSDARDLESLLNPGEDVRLMPI